MDGVYSIENIDLYLANQNDRTLEKEEMMLFLCHLLFSHENITYDFAENEIYEYKLRFSSSIFGNAKKALLDKRYILQKDDSKSSGKGRPKKLLKINSNIPEATQYIEAMSQRWLKHFSKPLVIKELVTV